MSDVRMRKHIEAAARLALRAQEWDVLDTLVTALRGTPKSVAKSDAQRAAEYRARRKSRHESSRDACDVTNRDASAPPPSDSPSLSDSGSSSDSSSFGSLKEASSLEQGERAAPADSGTVALFPIENETKPKRKRRRFAETDCPASDSTTGHVQAWCIEWRIDFAHREFAKFIDHHRSKGNRFRDWGAAWRKWLGNAQQYAQAAGARSVQPTDPNAPWMRDDHGRW